MPTANIGKMLHFTDNVCKKKKSSFLIVMSCRITFGLNWLFFLKWHLSVENLFLQLLFIMSRLIIPFTVSTHLKVKACEILTAVLPPAARVQESRRWQKRGSHCRRRRSLPLLWWCQKRHRPACHLHQLLEHEHQLHVNYCILYSTLTVLCVLLKAHPNLKQV